jgi:hypothetical protein
MDESIIKQISDIFNAGRIEGKGFILMPSINGFDVYEFDESKLKKVLHMLCLMPKNEDIEVLTGRREKP